MFECDMPELAPAICMLRNVEILYRTPFRNSRSKTQALVTTEVYGMALNLLDHLGPRGRSGVEPPTNNTGETREQNSHVNQKSPPASGYAFCSLHVCTSNACRLLSVAQPRQ